MRQITAEAVEAFYNRENFFKSNTAVRVTEQEVVMELFGNRIAGIDDKGVWITDAGWKTRTTFERLNGVLERLQGFQGFLIYKEQGQVYLNSREWEGEKTYIS